VGDLSAMILVSRGQHPNSQRAQRAPNDARAVEMALGLTSPEKIHLVHAGDPREDFLKQYLGMGLAVLTVLDLPDSADPLMTLVDFIQEQQPALVLTGTKAQCSEGSGFLPYAIAHHLKYTIAADVCEVTIDDTGKCVKILQAQPLGQRRILRAPLPLVATVGNAAAAPRMSTFAAARRGRIKTISVTAVEDHAAKQWRTKPARHRVARLKGMHSDNAKQRLQAATAMQKRTGGQVVEGLAADEAAVMVLNYLVDEGILDANDGKPCKNQWPNE